MSVTAHLEGGPYTGPAQVDSLSGVERIVLTHVGCSCEACARIPAASCTNPQWPAREHTYVRTGRPGAHVYVYRHSVPAQVLHGTAREQDTAWLLPS